MQLLWGGSYVGSQSPQMYYVIKLSDNQPDNTSFPSTFHFSLFHWSLLHLVTKLTTYTQILMFLDWLLEETKLRQC